MSEHRVVLATGTLYSALRRMLDDGWITRLTDISSTGDARERKLYRLTELGQRILQAEIVRLQKLVGLSQLRDIRQE
jgi:DNA-binding PadR family transcriptional regulator